MWDHSRMRQDRQIVCHVQLDTPRLALDPTVQMIAEVSVSFYICFCFGGNFVPVLQLKLFVVILTYMANKVVNLGVWI